MSNSMKEIEASDQRVIIKKLVWVFRNEICAIFKSTSIQIQIQRLHIGMRNFIDGRLIALLMMISELILLSIQFYSFIILREIC